MFQETNSYQCNQYGFHCTSAFFSSFFCFSFSYPPFLSPSLPGSDSRRSQYVLSAARSKSHILTEGCYFLPLSLPRSLLPVLCQSSNCLNLIHILHDTPPLSTAVFFTLQTPSFQSGATLRRKRETRRKDRLCAL